MAVARRHLLATSGDAPSDHGVINLSFVGNG
jgi:hypothetical protein